MIQIRNVFLASVLLALSGTLWAAPSDFDFSGTFTADNDIELLNFTVGLDSTITIFSSSWLSGDSGLGFDPILAIWDSAGDLIAQQDDGHNVGSTLSNGVWYNHGSWDSYFSVFLTAGNYQASIGQYNNFASGTNLTAGFVNDGNPNFTYDNGWGSQALFNGVWSGTDARTGDWEFHVLNVEAASRDVPEPMTLALLGLGLFGLGFSRRAKS